MKKLYLVNLSLMEKIADKKNGTVEDAAAFIICTELFFLLLSLEFIIIAQLPFRVSPYVLGGVSIVIWYYTNYIIRKQLASRIRQMRISEIYKTLKKSVARRYLALSVILFFINFFLFFFVCVMTLQGYYK